MSRHGECKVYVGDLGNDASKPELEGAFSYYGPLRSVWIARNPPGFAFIEFEDPRHAKDAIRGLDGRTICGRRARVELSNSRGYGRGPPPRQRVPPRPSCHCGDRGHFAGDCAHRRCRTRSGSQRRTRSRSQRRTRSRSQRRTRSRSQRRTRSRSRHHSGTRSRSPHAASRSLSLSRSVSLSRSLSLSRSRSKNRSTSGSKSRSQSQEYKKGG